jgi:hypothetical protein
MISPRGMWALQVLFVISICLYVSGGELGLSFENTWKYNGTMMNQVISNPLADEVSKHLMLYGLGFACIFQLAISKEMEKYVALILGREVPDNPLRSKLRQTWYVVKQTFRQLSRQNHIE